MVSAAEAHRIGKALASVADWTSEIVVVLNQEVTDETEQIVKSHGAKVIRVFPGIAAGGFAMAIGIPTAKTGSGGAAGRIGAASILTPN